MRPLRALPGNVQTAYHAALVSRLKLCGHDTGEGLCDEVAADTWRAMKAQGLRAKLVYGDYLHKGEKPSLSTGHYWVEVEGFIVDGTARQFGRRELVLVVEARRSRCYHPEPEEDHFWTDGDEEGLYLYCPKLMTAEERAEVW